MCYLPRGINNIPLPGCFPTILETITETQGVSINVNLIYFE